MGKQKIVTRMGKGGCYDPPGISLFFARFQRFWYQMKAFYVFSTVQKIFFEKKLIFDQVMAF